MYVEKFSVEGLHGFIDASLEFFPDLTVIVGRNGSGKTSILELMSHLIRLDLDAIGKANFSSALLTLNDNLVGRVLIQITNTPEDKKISLTIGDAEAAEIQLGISQNLLRFSGEIGTSFYNQSISRELQMGSIKRLERMFPGSDTWLKSMETIKEHTKLTFVRLDRTILAIDSEGSTSIDSGVAPKASRTERMTSGKDPIDDVIQVMRRNLLTYRSMAAKIQRNATSDLIKLHFSLPDILKQSKSGTTERQLRLKLQELQNRVAKSHLIANAPGIADVISSFFKGFELLLDQALPKMTSKKKTGRRTLQEETLEVVIGVKEQQITEMLRIFEREQNETSIAYQPIQRYLAVAAKFLDDSGKTLKFSPENLDLGFILSKTVTDDRNELTEIPGQQKVRSIKELSSGERQVLIVLTYLAFLAGKDSIFVVDEPELSLHVEWQRELVSALKELRPSNCQIIVATHAPEIAGRAKQNCRILNPSYLPEAE